jgi:3-oxoacyl-[acyl-carrier-protein] synthase-3
LGMRIVSVAMAAPPCIQTADDLAPLIGRSAEWIRESTGVACRRIAADVVSPSQLAAEAAQKALASTGTPDLILYAGALAQQIVPDTAAFVQRELGLERVPCFTVNQTCLSFVVALQVANGLLRAGTYQRILICTGELATRGRSFEEAEAAALLGDGGAAAVVELCDDPASDLIYSQLETWSDGLDLCAVRAGNHPRPRLETNYDDLFCFHMSGPRLYRFVRPRLKRFLATFLENAGTSIDDVKLIVPHQASGPGLRLLEQFGFSTDRIVNIVADYGNCAAASIPMSLAVATEAGRIERGDVVLLVGTAAGVSIGAALLRW